MASDESAHSMTDERVSVEVASGLVDFIETEAQGADFNEALSRFVRAHQDPFADASLQIQRLQDRIESLEAAVADDEE